MRPNVGKSNKLGKNRRNNEDTTFSKGTCSSGRQCGPPENGTSIDSHVPNLMNPYFRLLEALSTHTNHSMFSVCSKSGHLFAEDSNVVFLGVVKFQELVGTFTHQEFLQQNDSINS